MARLINLTPHVVVYFDRETGGRVELPPADMPARQDETLRELEPMPVLFENGTHPVRVVQIERSKVLNLPPPMPDVWYVVSEVTYRASPGRRDLLVPADVVRDTSGRPEACTAFGLF